MVIRSLVATCLACSLLIPSAWAAKVPKKSKKRHFALAYTPTETGTSSPCESVPGGIGVGTWTDKRSDKSSIGENREKDKSAPVTTDSDVPAHVRQALIDELSRSGCSIVESNALRTVDGEVTSYRVVLEGTYKSQATVRLIVRDASGKEVWSGIGRGEATRFSMLESPENYLQSLSDAVSRAFGDVFDDPGFVSSLGS